MLAVELDRVEADVHQHLHTVWARDTDRVLRVEHRRHSARDGGDELAVSRADSDPLAEDLSREDGIVDLGERDDLTGEGALQLDAGGGGLCRVARVGDRTGEAKRSGGRVTPENERGDKRHTEGDDNADEGVDDVHRVLGVHEHRDAREARTDGDEGVHVCEAHVGTGAKGTHDDGDERPPVLQRDAVESRLGDAEERGDAGRERGRAEALVLGAERDAKGGARLREVVREGCSEVQRLAAGVGDCRDRRGEECLVHADGDDEGEHAGEERHGDPTEGLVPADDGGREERPEPEAKWPDGKHGDRYHDEEAHERHEEDADRAGRDAVEEALDPPEQDHRQDRGEYLRCVADGWHGDAEQRDAAVLSDERRESGEHEHRHGTERHRSVDLQLRRGCVGDEQRQEREDGVGDGRKHLVTLRLLVDPADGREEDHERFQDAGAGDGRDDGREDADDEVHRDGARTLPGEGLLGLLAAAFCCAGRLGADELLDRRIDLDDSVADDDLRLRAVDRSEHARHRTQLVEASLARVVEREAQPGRAVLQRLHVLGTADAIVLTESPIARLDALEPAAGARHDDANMASIDQ